MQHDCVMLGLFQSGFYSLKAIQIQAEITKGLIALEFHDMCTCWNIENTFVSSIVTTGNLLFKAA